MVSRAMHAVLALLLAATSAPVAGQGRTAPDPATRPTAPTLQQLVQSAPRVAVQPATALLRDGSYEHGLAARFAWPGLDTARQAVQVVADFSSRNDTEYLRTGVRLSARRSLGAFALSGGATVAGGVGDGPRQSFALSTGADLAALGLSMRATRFHAAPADAAGDGTGAVSPGSRASRQPRAAHYADVELHARYRTGRAAIRLTGGRRLTSAGQETDHWLFTDADVPVHRRFGIVAAGGVRPDRTDLGQTGGRFVQLGLRLDIRAPETPAALPVPVPIPDRVAQAPAIEPLGTDRYRFSLKLRGARSAELTGDVSDWNVIALRRSARGDDIWETTLHRAAGVYRISVRVDDGAWIVPPGLVEVPDRFGGSAGVLILPTVPFTEEVIHEN